MYLDLRNTVFLKIWSLRVFLKLSWIFNVRYTRVLSHPLSAIYRGEFECDELSCPWYCYFIICVYGWNKAAVCLFIKLIGDGQLIDWISFEGYWNDALAALLAGWWARAADIFVDPFILLFDHIQFNFNAVLTFEVAFDGLQCCSESFGFCFV